MDKYKKTKNIALLLPDLRGGGAERVFMNLARQFTRSGYHVDFVLMQAHGELLTQIPDGARVVDLKAHRIRQSFWPLVRYLRQTRPDSLLIGMWPLTIAGILAHILARDRSGVFVSDHSHLSASPVANGWIKKFALSLSMWLVYPLADGRLAVSQGVAKDLSLLSGLPRDKFKVIYNPIVDDSILVKETIDPWIGLAGKRILAVGALKSAKDYPTLIHAFARFHSKQESSLVILGDGDLRAELEQLIKTLDLTKSVFLAGFVIDPAPWYSNADLFVLSSRWEGFGNVIVEAMQCGVPVVSTDCPSGPSEILEGGRYGSLVPVGDYSMLAEAMVTALNKQSDAAALKARANDFTVDKIAREYLDTMFPISKCTGK